jgi:hypothetical protein
MKKLIIFILLAAIFVSCGKRQCICNGYTIDNHPCRCVILQGKIGNNFDSALDSLERYYEPEFNLAFKRGFYSGQGYFVEKHNINVDFFDDNREFFQVFFMDSVVTYRWLNVNDILDEKGNYYIYYEGRKD